LLAGRGWVVRSGTNFTRGQQNTPSLCTRSTRVAMSYSVHHAWPACMGLVHVLFPDTNIPCYVHPGQSAPTVHAEWVAHANPGRSRNYQHVSREPLCKTSCCTRCSTRQPVLGCQQSPSCTLKLRTANSTTLTNQVSTTMPRCPHSGTNQPVAQQAGQSQPKSTKIVLAHRSSNCLRALDHQCV